MLPCSPFHFQINPFQPSVASLQQSYCIMEEVTEGFPHDICSAFIAEKKVCCDINNDVHGPKICSLCFTLFSFLMNSRYIRERSKFQPCEYFKPYSQTLEMHFVYMELLTHERIKVRMIDTVDQCYFNCALKTKFLDQLYL